MPEICRLLRAILPHGQAKVPGRPTRANRKMEEMA
jgi:hypothetical protein